MFRVPAAQFARPSLHPDDRPAPGGVGLAQVDGLLLRHGALRRGRLAAGVDVLIHEASGEGPGHSSARQAGEAARHAEAAKLLLIHYPTGKYQPSDLVEEARSQFAGEIALAEDFMTIDLG